jgi:hypothetical protein
VLIVVVERLRWATGSEGQRVRQDHAINPRGRVPWSGGIEGVVVNLSDGAGAGR